MIMAHWTGKAVSDNAKTIRDNRGNRRNSGEYTAYRASVSWTIRQQHLGVRLGRPHLIVQFCLGTHCDAPNMLKGLLDGIQDSQIVDNDRNIVTVHVLPTLRHPRGSADEAWLVFYEGDQ